MYYGIGLKEVFVVFNFGGSQCTEFFGDSHFYVFEVYPFFEVASVQKRSFEVFNFSDLHSTLAPPMIEYLSATSTRSSIDGIA